MSKPRGTISREVNGVLVFLCRICGAEKQEADFPRRKDGTKKDRPRNECCACLSAYKKKYHLENLDRIRELKKARYHKDPQKHLEQSRRYRYRDIYGFTVEQYDAMAAAQDNLCKICRRSPMGKKKRFCVDHDHATGRVRGLLCTQCNSALGKFGDTVEGLERAIMYLKGLL